MSALLNVSASEFEALAKEKTLSVVSFQQMNNKFALLATSDSGSYSVCRNRINAPKTWGLDQLTQFLASLGIARFEVRHLDGRKEFVR